MSDPEEKEKDALSQNDDAAPEGQTSTETAEAVRKMETLLDQGIPCPYCRTVMPCGPKTRAKILQVIAEGSQGCFQAFSLCDNKGDENGEEECPSMETDESFFLEAGWVEGKIELNTFTQAQLIKDREIIRTRIKQINEQRSIGSAALTAVRKHNEQLLQENFSLGTKLAIMEVELEENVGAKQELEAVRDELLETRSRRDILNETLIKIQSELTELSLRASRADGAKEYLEQALADSTSRLIETEERLADTNLLKNKLVNRLFEILFAADLESSQSPQDITDEEWQKITEAIERMVKVVANIPQDGEMNEEVREEKPLTPEAHDDRTTWERFLDENPLGRIIAKFIYQ